MKSIKNIFTLLVVALVGLTLTACSEDDLDTNQYKGGISLNAFGPNPVMRGGTLRFVGSNLDQVASIQIPGVAPITNYESVKSGIPSEIRVTVPKDGPEVGIITMKTKDDQTITTQKELTYIEGIEITGFTPAAAMPGDVIKIEGDYLNLIYSLAFADDVLVSSNDFVAQDRYFIEVRVPDKAKTGKLTLYTADLTIQRTKEEEDNLEYQIIVSDEALEIGLPTVTQMKARNTAEPMGNILCKAGETILIYGSYLNIVEDVTIGGVSAIYMQYVEGKGISCMLPLEAPDGDILLVCKSGVEVPIGTLTTVKPSECVAAPNPVKAGQKLTIKGKDMNIVSSVEFPTNVEGATANAGEIEVTADQVVVKSVPDNAVDGNMLLMMANGMSVEVPFTLVKPTVSGYDHASVSAGGALTIKGTDLDLVKTVQFGESDVVKVEGAADAITLTVPMNAQSGVPTLTLANGTTVANVPAINIEEAVFCYATALPGEEDEIKAGESLTLPVANGDKLTGVQIDGNDCQFVLVKNNTELIIGIPESAKKASKVRLISSNGEITYTIDFIPNSEVTTVLWSGAIDMGNWSINWQIGDGTAGASNPKMFVDMDLQEGDLIRVYVTPYNDWWQIQFFDGHWGKQDEIGVATGLNNGYNINAGIYNLEEHGGCIEIPVTATLKQQLTTLCDWGYCWILQGENLVVNKITVTHYTVLEQTLWTGDIDFGAWSINWQIGDGTAGLSNPNMFVDLGLKVGQTLRLYITPTSDWWQVQFFDGHWGAQSEIGVATGLNNGNNVNPNIYDLSAHNGAIEIPVTATIATQLTTLNDWGYCWILQGENCHATKITLE